MFNSLVKFANETGSAGKKLWWARAGVDGLPFRGPSPPIMPEEEYEARAVRISDFRNDFFDVLVPEQNKNFCRIMECCANGWFRLYHLERFWRDPNGVQTTKHYLEWFEYYMEDGNRTPFMSSGMMELANGHANLKGYSG